MHLWTLSLAIMAMAGLAAPALATDSTSQLGTYNPDSGGAMLVDDDDFKLDIRIGGDRPYGRQYYRYDGPRYYDSYGYGGATGSHRYYDYDYDREPRRYYNPSYNWRTDDREFGTWYGGRIKEGEIELDNGEIEFDDGKIEYDD
jgi:hypothetical protein